MAKDYTIEQVLGTEDQWSNDYGQFLPYKLKLSGVDAEVVLNRKLQDGQVPQAKVPQPGQTLHLEVSSTSHGMRGKEVQRQDGQQASSNSSSGGRDNPDTRNSIERQVAAKAAAEMAAAAPVAAPQMAANFEGLFDAVLTKIQGDPVAAVAPAQPAPAQGDAIPF